MKTGRRCRHLRPALSQTISALSESSTSDWRESLLLDVELVVHGAHAVHGAGEFTGPRLRVRVVDEARELHAAFTRLDVALVRLRARVTGESGLHLGGDGGVIDHR